MRAPTRFLPIVVALAALSAVISEAESDVSSEQEFMRGMVVSCPRAGQIWGSPLMEEALRSLGSLGVEWISIHPYAGVRQDGTVRQRPAAEAGYLKRAGDLVDDAGMRLFWKPHLAYWGSFEWRGTIEFADEAAWQRFFDGYRTFILDQARFAESLGVELFALGVELEGTTHRPEWIELIAAVREVYSGRLTYAANWDRLEAVPFWERLDLIGVHAYFPLSFEAAPSITDLQTGWESALAGLRSLSERLGGKPVFFAEIGYNRSPAAASEPWAYTIDDTPEVRHLRQRLIELAIQRAEGEPLVTGMFWWKWIPGPLGHDRDFSMKDPEARAALQHHWAPAAIPTAE